MIIDSTVWGPHGWKFIHMVALGYPSSPTDEEKKNYKKFFLNIANILPCIICSNHYKENLIKHPITEKVLENKTNLLHWTIDMHNEVNAMNNSKIYTYEEALKLIRNNYQDETNENINTNNQAIDNNINQAKTNNDKYLDYLFTIFCVIVIFLLFIFFLSIK
jgi:hypothetical protein